VPLRKQILGAVVKNVAEVGTAFIAIDIISDHSVGVIRCSFDSVAGGVPKSWPTGTGVVLGI